MTDGRYGKNETIPFAVVEQVLPHAIVLFLRNLPRHKQEPTPRHSRSGGTTPRIAGVTYFV